VGVCVHGVDKNKYTNSITLQDKFNENIFTTAEKIKKTNKQSLGHDWNWKRAKH
jgi:hypothetical protein